MEKGTSADLLHSQTERKVSSSKGVLEHGLLSQVKNRDKYLCLVPVVRYTKHLEMNALLSNLFH